jgi:hypothetical protein
MPAAATDESDRYISEWILILGGHRVGVLGQVVKVF